MPRPTEIPLARAAALFAAGHYADAAFSYRAVLSIDPSDHRAYLGLADCAVGRGNRDDAVEELVGAAQDFADRSDWEAAFALLGHALSLDPERLELHVDVAELEAAAGRLEMAIGRLGNLARAYEQLGQYEDAAAIHDVLGAWKTSPPTGEFNAAPEPVLRGMTQPVDVSDLEAEPEPAPDLPAPREVALKPLLPGTPNRVANVATESVLLRKAPPPPPPPRPARNATTSPTPGAVQHEASGNTVKTALPPAPDARPPAPPRKKTTRGPGRSAKARRWRPSTVQHLPEAPPLRPRGPVAAKPAKKSKPTKSKLSIAPAPSPSRGSVKLDRLPSLTGPCEVVSTRSVPSKIVAKATKRMLTATSTKAKPKVTGAYKAAPKKAEPKKAEPQKEASKTTQPRRLETRKKPAGAPSLTGRAASRPLKSSLADRLRRTSNSVMPEPAKPKSDFDDEATRLWAPEGLLL